MKRLQHLSSLLTLCTLSLLLAACGSLGSEAVLDQTGNGAPKGAHDYQLLIIGVDNEKTADMEDSNRHTIFVPLYGKSKIELIEGEFAVLDGNAFDDPAQFQLPAPGVDAYIVGDPGSADVESDYSVFVRPLGKPGGWATMTTCADLVDSSFGGLLGGADRKVVNEAADLGGYCSLEQVAGMMESDTLFRNKGKERFVNVTAELTTIVFEIEIDVDGDGEVDEIVTVRAPIFDDALENEYWEVDNNGLRLIQIRFYDCSTNVETGQSTCEY